MDMCPMARIFAYGATCPAFKTDHKTDDIRDFDNVVPQSMCEVASILSILTGKQISVAMTVDKLVAEIQSDEQYKYRRQTLAGNEPTIYVGDLKKNIIK